MRRGEEEGWRRAPASRRRWWRPTTTAQTRITRPSVRLRRGCPGTRQSTLRTTCRGSTTSRAWCVAAGLAGRHVAYRRRVSVSPVSLVPLFAGRIASDAGGVHAHARSSRRPRTRRPSRRPWTSWWRATRRTNPHPSPASMRAASSSARPSRSRCRSRSSSSGRRARCQVRGPSCTASERPLSDTRARATHPAAR